MNRNIGQIKSKPLAIISIIALWTIIELNKIIESLKGKNNAR